MELAPRYGQATQTLAICAGAAALGTWSLVGQVGLPFTLSISYENALFVALPSGDVALPLGDHLLPATH